MRDAAISSTITVFVLPPARTVTVSADMGPKPGTSITVHPGGGEYAVFCLDAGKLDAFPQ